MDPSLPGEGTGEVQGLNVRQAATGSALGGAIIGALGGGFGGGMAGAIAGSIAGAVGGAVFGTLLAAISSTLTGSASNALLGFLLGALLGSFLAATSARSLWLALRFPAAEFETYRNAVGVAAGFFGGGLVGTIVGGFSALLGDQRGRGRRQGTGRRL